MVYYIWDVLFPSEYPIYSEYEQKVTKISKETFCQKSQIKPNQEK